MFLLSVSNWLRFWKGIHSYPRLAALELTVPAWYLPLSGAVWGFVALAAALGLWRRRPWARPLTLAASVLYAIAYWADRLLLTTSPYLRQSIPIAAFVTLAGLAFVWIVLNQPAVRRAFRRGDLNDSRPEDRTTTQP